MIAAGIDLGGTKIEAQVFGSDWGQAQRRRIDTPRDYAGLVAAMADQIGWIESLGGQDIPVGVSAAGLINPGTGLALTANLPATGKPFPADIAAASGHPVTYINDCRAFILSEATFGAARGASPALGLILGTGIAGGVVIGGRLMSGHATVGGEFGHFPISAGPVQAHGLPVLRCGCGRMGCTETLLAGPGLSRLAAHLTGRTASAEEIAAGRAGDPELARVWAVWLELAADMLVTLCFTIDPQVIVLGGGLSNIRSLYRRLPELLAPHVFSDQVVVRIVPPKHGDASGVRGAAWLWPPAAALSPPG